MMYGMDLNNFNIHICISAQILREATIESISKNGNFNDLRKNRE